VRLLVTAVAVLAVALAACDHETELKESPQQIAQERAAADAHNADTVPFAGDDETPSTDLPSTTTTALPEYEGAQALHVGDCVDLPAPQTASVRPIACGRPHHEEVTGFVDIGPRFPNGAPTPEDFRLITDTDCKQAFDAFVRQPPPQGLEPSSYDIRPEEWYLGEHRVVCTASADRDGNVLTGSVRK
jgi:hypothetical protein